MTKRQHPIVYIIAGPNGAGKTTFAKEFLPNYAKCKHFINADLIAQGLSPFSPQSAALKAGRLLLEEIQKLVGKEVDFAFESTLSGKTYALLLGDLKRKGYKIHIVYLWMPVVELGLARIKERVAQGGHHVPARDVRRRFKRSLENFLKVYKPLADHWDLIDNSLVPARQIAKGVAQKIEISNQVLYTLIMRGINEENKA